MEKGRERIDADAVRSAQRLRLRRILGGCLSFACTGVIVVCSWLFGYLEGAQVVHFALAVIAINAIAIALLLTNVNLRLQDPSMTGPLIIASLAPSVYVMMHVEEPMIRAAFLLMGTVAMLYGALAFDFRRMLQIGGIALITYLLMILTLHRVEPQRVDLQVELVLFVS